MGRPVATEGAKVVGVDVHVVLVPSPGGPVPTPLPHPFGGTLDGALVASVTVGGRAVATVDSRATNSPGHQPTPPGVSFQRPPADSGVVVTGSATVTVGGRRVARVGDQVRTCNDPADQPVGTIVGPVGTVSVG